MKYLVVKTRIKCPYCGIEKGEEMPLYIRTRSYLCEYCKKTIEPKKNECCVFCSYGSIKCPQAQIENRINF
jgi:hypothetical protein